MTAMRRLLVQVHLWVGVASGLYIVVVCLTGAALVFRIDLQRARNPHLFTPRASGLLADPVRVMERVSRRVSRSSAFRGRGADVAPADLPGLRHQRP